MDGISVAASVIGIATAGIQISIKLITLATQVSTASDRISSIGNDVSLTSGVLQQLGELMTQKTSDDYVSIFSQGGLETTKTAAAMCQRVFEEIEKETKVASEQLRGSGRMKGGKIKLSIMEKARFPFLQPTLEILRADLREAKGTLMLMLQVTTLAFSRRMAEFHKSATLNENEQKDLVHAILAIQNQQEELASERFDEIPQGFVPAKAGIGSSRSNTFVNLPLSSSEKTEALALTPSVISISTDGLINDYSTPEPPNKLEKEIFSNSHRSLRCSSSPPDTANNEDNADEEKGDVRLFILKPIVQDLADVIQLSWAVHNVKMHRREIYKEVDKNDRQEMPSTLEIIETLLPHEHRAVNHTVCNAGPDSWLVSLRRTKNNIHHREMIFQGVPGLQFVVQQGISQPTTRTIIQPPSRLIRQSVDQPLRYPFFRQRVFSRKAKPSQPPIRPDASSLRLTDLHAEFFKSSRVPNDEPCRIVLSAMLKKYNINADWRNYLLYIVSEGYEHLVGWEEKPLLLFKQLEQEGRKPAFVLRLSEPLKEPTYTGDTIRRPKGTRSQENPADDPLLSPASYSSPSTPQPLINSRMNTIPFFETEEVGREEEAEEAEQVDEVNESSIKFSTSCDPVISQIQFKGGKYSHASMDPGELDETNEETEDEEIVNELLGKYTTLFEAH